MDTVDVTYPSSPLFLLLNPELLQAQLEPLMRYPALPHCAGSRRCRSRIARRAALI
jgi:Domain of unknown function (DUF4965)